MLSRFQSSLFNELVQRRFLCKALYCWQGFLLFTQGLFIFLSEFELQKPHFEMVIFYTHFTDEEKKRNLMTCSKSFGQSQSLGLQMRSLDSTIVFFFFFNIPHNSIQTQLSILIDLGGAFSSDSVSSLTFVILQ